MTPSRIALAVAAGALGAAPASAQELADTEELSEGAERNAIVVIGTRTSRDITLSSDLATEIMSQSSRSLEQDVLRAAGAYRLSDALELVSGSSQQNNRGGFADNFAIRGFLSTADGGGEYYADGFIVNRGSAPARDPATIERVEILKGPAGAVFGDIDPAGRVNMVSKTPRFARHASATLTYGSFDTWRGELDVTGPLTDTLAARIVVAAEDSDGFRDFVGLKRRVISPSLTFRPSGDVEFTYLAQRIIYDSPFDRGVIALDRNPDPAVTDLDANALPASRFLGEPSNGDTRARDTRHQLTGEAKLGGSWSLVGGIAYRTGSLRGFSADQNFLATDGRTLRRQRRERGYEVEDLSARLELRGKIEAWGTHNASVGIKGYTLDYLELLNRRNPTAADPYAIDIFEPVYGDAQALPLLPNIDQREKRRSLTLYAQDMWEVNERLTFVGGVRFDTYRQKLTKNLTGAVSVAADEPVNFRIGGRYALTDSISVHANWGESFLLNSGSGSTGAAFAPEQGRGYEVGLSSRWQALDVGLTYFDIRKSNVLTTDPNDVNYLAPVGSLRSRGVEFDASLRLGRGWIAVANYAYTHARNDDESFATPLALNVPDHSGTVFVVHKFDMGTGRDWSLSGGVAYVGERSGATDSTGLMLPSYWKVKAAAEIPITAALTARAEVDNLLNERYAQSSYNRFWIYPGAPRTIRVSLRAEI
ncbi:TonB-dependent siderophore receptor [Novosphingobium sp. FGD1]|uniref:TonB-dependent siderophore receptor n=1 Tax=Novosphingobium silvae TaxID=2692619 RepID=A0A7X4GK84_9SPHN|nr:TonB-dependent siderophore receptor [Novosphingobium silvae]MYM00129.1 TonB-dependent siderophore receptor [Novosphingobium silvae]